MSHQDTKSRRKTWCLRVLEATFNKNMNHKALSIRPFIGAKNFEISRKFYQDLGFQEAVLGHNFSYFHTEGIGFYLQDAYVKDWIDNSMIFMEVDSVLRYYQELLALNLSSKYEGVRLVPIQTNDWGKECFLHDPSGILWHFGEFSKS
jgi:hypothetical protein